jgi:hypothetical protein
MMQQIDGAKRYEIGRMKKDSLDQPEQGEYLYTPVVLTGDQLHKLGILTWNEFFEGAPPNFQVGRLYHVFESRTQAEKKLVALGTITSLRNPNAPQGMQQSGLSDADSKMWSMMSGKESPHNIKFFKEQLSEKESEIKRLNLKIEEITKELIKAKEDKVFAEQELRRTIGLNDAINAKEEEYIQAMEKAQKQQQDSSNRILENLMMIAQQGMQLWMASKGQNPPPMQPQAIQAPVPVGDPLTSKNDGDIIPIKNKKGEIENWTVKTMGDKKVIVSPDGKMKTFA